MIEYITLFGKEISLYHTFNILGFVAIYLLGAFLFCKHDMSVAKAVIYTSCQIGIGYVCILLGSWISGGGKTNGINYVRGIYLEGMFYYLLARLLKDQSGKVADSMAVISLYGFINAKVRCIFSGCCHGYPAQWGLYSKVAQTVCFPVQLCEIATAVVIMVVLLWMIKRRIAQGQIYAYFLVLYGATRFIWEFFRDNEKVWRNISELAIHAVIAIIVGLVIIAGAKWSKGRKQKHEKV